MSEPSAKVKRANHIAVDPGDIQFHKRGTLNGGARPVGWKAVITLKPERKRTSVIADGNLAEPLVTARGVRGKNGTKVNLAVQSMGGA
jgi:hypothetical protein